MYVCVCNAVTERDIAEAVDAGARSLCDLSASLGVGTCCGQCEPMAEALLTSRSGCCRAMITDQRDAQHAA